MELIHVDGNFNELGVVDFIRFDGVISLNAEIDDNDWEAEIPAEDFGRYDISLGDYLFIPGLEFGGSVETVQHVSKSGIVKLGGLNWRGMLIRKIISPPAGTSHLDLREMELNAAIGQLVEANFGGLFQASNEDSGLLCGKRFRYQNVLEGITDMLDTHGMRLTVTLDEDSRRVMLSAEAIADHSNEIEFSGDYDLSYTSTLGQARFNHIIALGRGEQENRTVRHLYLLPDGSITDNATAEGVAVGAEERAMVYDYPNGEDESELLDGARKRLRENAAQNTIEFSFDAPDIDLPLGDKVGLRDRITGMADVKTISQKLLVISDDGVTLQYKVE